MRRRISRLAAVLVVTLTVLMSGAVPVLAAPVVVDVRVEGATSTIFEGPVYTDGHDITTASGGTHRCDGTNNNANPKPGPTATAALDDAAELGRFTFDATFFPEFEDFFIIRIGPDTQTETAFWGILLNGRFTEVGGCQQRIRSGDEVLFAYDAFEKEHFLELTGPSVATTGHPITVTVTDEMNGRPIAGATVNGSTTGADGKATVTFDTVGVKRLKAERADAIRSNSLYVMVLR